jgi:hypothetical protein
MPSKSSLSGSGRWELTTLTLAQSVTGHFPCDSKFVRVTLRALTELDRREVQAENRLAKEARNVR